jgi:hypothetical protein
MIAMMKTVAVLGAAGVGTWCTGAGKRVAPLSGVSYVTVSVAAGVYDASGSWCTCAGRRLEAPEGGPSQWDVVDALL